MSIPDAKDLYHYITKPRPYSLKFQVFDREPSFLNTFAIESQTSYTYRNSLRVMKNQHKMSPILWQHFVGSHLINHDNQIVLIVSTLNTLHNDNEP